MRCPCASPPPPPLWVRCSRDLEQRSVAVGAPPTFWRCSRSLGSAARGLLGSPACPDAGHIVLNRHFFWSHSTRPSHPCSPHLPFAKRWSDWRQGCCCPIGWGRCAHIFILLDCSVHAPTPMGLVWLIPSRRAVSRRQANKSFAHDAQAVHVLCGTRQQHCTAGWHRSLLAPHTSRVFDG